MFEDLGKYIYTNEIKKSKRDITHIVIHCAATEIGKWYEAIDIHEWHKKRTWIDRNGVTRPWSGIGYHYVLLSDGNIQIGRDIDYDGAHVKGHNKNTIGICLIGGLQDGKPTENAFTKDQYLVLTDFISKLMGMYPKAKVLGHRDFEGVKKQCPCLEVSKFTGGTLW